jgi:hypothetical protein
MNSEGACQILRGYHIRGCSSAIALLGQWYYSKDRKVLKKSVYQKSILFRYNVRINEPIILHHLPQMWKVSVHFAQP